jgi:putative nucleotidyltransferase with HDIG domain
MKKILFVDDDPSILNGLKRMLRPLSNEWDMHFVLSADAALNLLEEGIFDVIVSDMRMQGMDGAELLGLVQKNYPHMVRIIFSGYADQDLVQKALRPAHQYLSKPCDALILKRTVQRSSDIQNIVGSAEVKQIIAQVDSLPSLPQLYNEIMTKLQDRETSIKDVGEIIQKDVGMTAQILKLVNSSFYGFYDKISNPVQAAALLGLDTIKTIVLSVEIFSTLKGDPKFDVYVNRLWRHCTLTANLAKQIAGLITDDKKFIEDAFLSGFLHDIGILILASKLPEKYSKVINRPHDKEKEFWEIEKQLLGVSHAEIGAYLLALWGFEDTIIDAISHHHNTIVRGDEPKSLITVTHLANSFAHRLDETFNNDPQKTLNIEYLENINALEQTKEWFRACKSQYETGELD